MVRFEDKVTLAQSKIDELSEVYSSEVEPLPQKSDECQIEGRTRRMDEAYRLSLIAADGDHRRLERTADGGVIVHNKPRRR